MCPSNRWASVVLPLPLSPAMAVIVGRSSPSVNEMPSSATTLSRFLTTPPPYTLETARSSRSGKGSGMTRTCRGRRANPRHRRRGLKSTSIIVGPYGTGTGAVVNHPYYRGDSGSWASRSEAAKVDVGFNPRRGV